MKKLLTSYFFLLASSFLAAKADLLYFMADAYNDNDPLLFDYAMIGVAKYVNSAWTTTWGEGKSKMYLRLYDSTDATLDGNSAAATVAQVEANISAYTRGSDSKSYYSVGYADVSDYTADIYKFYVETYSNDEDDPVMSCFEGEAKSYEELLAENHIYIPGETNPQDVTPWAVPEPSSGLLLLLGAGLAAWRRRRVRFASRGSRLLSCGSRLASLVSCPCGRARNVRQETRD